MDTRMMVKAGGISVAMSEAIAPWMPLNLYPSPVARLTDMDPGADCAMDATSRIESRSIAFLLLWYSFSSTGMVMYPPPKAIKLEYSDTVNISFKLILFI